MNKNSPIRYVLFLGIFIGTVAGAASVIYNRKTFYEDFYADYFHNISKNLIDENQHKNQSPLTELDNERNGSRENTTNDKQQTQALKLKRTASIFSNNGILQNETISYYKFDIHFNDKTKKADAVLKVINQDQVTNKIDILLTAKNIQNAADLTSQLRDLPFRFTIQQWSKPPIVTCPEFFKFNDWNKILKKINTEKTIRIPYVESINLIEPRPTYDLKSNISQLVGEIRISMDNNTIYIESDAEGEIDIQFVHEAAQKQSKQDLILNGTFNREYTLLIHPNQLYVPKKIYYKTTSDLITNNVFQQKIEEVIETVEN